MPNKDKATPKEFYDRADEIIALANAQLVHEHRGKVSASTLYAAARFNAFVSASSYSDGDEMAKDLAEISDYFVEQYREMLNDQLEDFAANFSKNLAIPNTSREI